MNALVQKLIGDGALKTSLIIEAFKKVARADFVPESIRSEAWRDEALPTFEDQTISQPYTVAFMLELLDAHRGETILDVGSGSGWVSALLASIVGPKGKVYGIERVEDLVEFCKNNLGKYNFKNVKIIHGDGTQGLKEYAPFDRVHVAAAALAIPKALKEQLKIGGKMVIPTKNNDIRLIEKISKTQYTERIYPGFVFVPLIADDSDGKALG